MNGETVSLEEFMNVAQDYIDALNSLLSVHCGGTHATQREAAEEVARTHQSWRELRLAIVNKRLTVVSGQDTGNDGVAR